MSPKQSVKAECARRGRQAVVAGCVDLLLGKDADPQLIVALGGPPATWATVGGEGGPDYWLRVWAARGLLYAWDESAMTAISIAMSDHSWRVREMAAKVAARHLLGDLHSELEQLRHDPVPRVQEAADRSVARIVAAGE